MNFIGVISSGSRGDRGTSLPPNPKTFAKDGEHSMPQPAMRIDIRKIFKFSLNFSNFY